MTCFMCRFQAKHGDIAAEKKLMPSDVLINLVDAEYNDIGKDEISAGIDIFAS